MQIDKQTLLQAIEQAKQASQQSMAKSKYKWHTRFDARKISFVTNHGPQGSPSNFKSVWYTYRASNHFLFLCFIDPLAFVASLNRFVMLRAGGAKLPSQKAINSSRQLGGNNVGNNTVEHIVCGNFLTRPELPRVRQKVCRMGHKR